MTDLPPQARLAETYAEVEDALLSRWPETRLEPSLDRITALTEMLGERGDPVQRTAQAGSRASGEDAFLGLAYVSASRPLGEGGVISAILFAGHFHPKSGRAPTDEAVTEGPCGHGGHRCRAGPRPAREDALGRTSPRQARANRGRGSPLSRVTRPTPAGALAPVGVRARRRSRTRPGRIRTGAVGQIEKIAADRHGRPARRRRGGTRGTVQARVGLVLGDRPQPAGRPAAGAARRPGVHRRADGASGQPARPRRSGPRGARR